MGRVWKYGDDINTDVIIPARYLFTTDPAELAAHCMEDLDPSFAGKVRPGDVIVAGRNFGCGSSREHAPVAIRAAGVACVIAVSFARIFYRNAINVGLPILECPKAVAALEDGDEVEVDVAAGTIRRVATRETFQAAPFPPFMQEILRCGGLVEYARRKLAAAAAGGSGRPEGASAPSA